MPVLARRARLGDVEGAGEDDHRVAAQVLADDPVEGQQALDQGVVAGDGVQAGLGLGPLVAGERGELRRQRPGGADAGVLVQFGELGG